MIDSLKLSDIGHTSAVCKIWNEWLRFILHWSKMSKEEGLPLVNGNLRKVEEYYKLLKPLTVGGQDISEFFGNLIGEVPKIHEYWISKLKEKDPFDETKTIGEDYSFLVVPNSILRPKLNEDNAEGPLYLVQDPEDGNLMESTMEVDEEEILPIPFSPKNLKELCYHPLKKGKIPVLSGHPEYNNDFSSILDSYKEAPDKMKVYLIRKEAWAASRGYSSDEQEKLVKAKGFEVASILPVLLYNAISVLREGKLPEQNTKIMPRTSDTYGQDGRLAIQYESTGRGFRVVATHSKPGLKEAVVPIVSVEEPPKTLNQSDT